MSSGTIGVGLFNFKAQYVRYAEYHSNRVNQNIHTIFVPTILLTSFIIAGHFNTSVMCIGAAAYSLYYFILHPVIGGSASVLVGGLAAFAASFLKHGKEWTGVEPISSASIAFVIAWIAQFIGHGVYERRAPALLDNLVQALVLAPFFVWSHALFDIGFYKNLNQELKNETGKRVAAFRAKQTAAKKL
ncbi:hypothetical protein HDU83_002844 [Entophlyctis luteolus]|nr:hypothetical protein HDU83_002844 [Entophlyctis luteolus]